jgi:hypothetical protein
LVPAVSRAERPVGLRSRREPWLNPFDRLERGTKILTNKLREVAPDLTCADLPHYLDRGQKRSYGDVACAVQTTPRVTPQTLPPKHDVATVAEHS